MNRHRINSVEVCIAAVNADLSLLDRMNIQSDCIVGNQCDHNEVAVHTYRGHKAKWLSFNERGVGLNRNNALMRTSADVVIFADDDMVFDSGYVDTATRLFERNPKADVIIFNIRENGSGLRRTVTRKPHYTRKIGYGASRIAVRREVISMCGIGFNQNFGGGSMYSCGEDTLFLAACVKRKLKLLCVPESIATLSDDRPSSWFQGYTEKYYYDFGMLYAAAEIPLLYLRLCKAVLFDKRVSSIPKSERLKRMMQGAGDFKTLKGYKA